MTAPGALPTAEWRPIANTEYEISSLGDVRHKYYRLVRHLRRDHRGYLRVVIRNTQGKVICPAVHRLVAAAFLGPRPNGQQVNHKDADKTHNAATNLEYVSPHENRDHARARGLIARVYGERNGSSKLSADQVRLIRERHASGESCNRIAADFPVSDAAIWLIIARKRWAHV